MNPKATSNRTRSATLIFSLAFALFVFGSATQQTSAGATARLGPQTEPVIMTGYAERTDYHQLRYVSIRTGSDEMGDGSMRRPWATIRHALQSIDDARLSNRYAILVGAGTYGEKTLKLKSYVDLWGGFEARTWDRDIHRHRTVLDGNRHRRIAVAADHIRIDGFVIQYGTARGPGGGILCNGVAPMIANNYFISNRTLQPKGWEPEFLHEIGNDGGAIAALNGAAPVIRNNVFAFNSTETGRGAGIAAHNRAEPKIIGNVFVDNVSGTDDPMRSSDGGAISAVQYSNPEIRGNVMAGNRALDTNDGGAIFIELWSSAVIDGNWIVGSFSDDDGGGLFLAGQQHHYITLHDPIPPKMRFYNVVRNNIIMGNHTSSGEGAVHGVLRATNDTRMQFKRNLVAFNVGGIDFRQSEVSVSENTIFADILVRDGGGVVRFERNVLSGELIRDADTVVEDSIELSGTAADGIAQHFEADGAVLDVASATFDDERIATTLRLRGGVPAGIEPGRVIRTGNAWTVVKSASPEKIVVWGYFSAGTGTELVPTFTPRSDSPVRTIWSPPAPGPSN